MNGLINRILLMLVISGVFAGKGRAAETGITPLIASWIQAQTNLQTWSADFIQTRKLKVMVQPLMATGHVWFAAPNRFRWELGNPPQTIAVRASTELLLFYPKLKRVERFPLGGAQTGPWRDALALLETGFPRNRAELEARYTVVSQTVTGNSAEVVLQPKSAPARRMMPHIKIFFDTKDFSLLGTELEFADGSTMRNDFANPVFNPKLDPKIFEPEIPKDYKVIEPLKNR